MIMIMKKWNEGYQIVAFENNTISFELWGIALTKEIAINRMKFIVNYLSNKHWNLEYNTSEANPVDQHITVWPNPLEFQQLFKGISEMGKIK